METEEAARALARSERGAMKAPAGCGKTQVIASAVARFGSRRELVLTHTHAGVDAIRRRLLDLGAPADRYHLDTIASWSLRLARGFPRSANLQVDQPRSNEDYRAAYSAATRLVALSPIREILRASYSGMFVDEYQDCTLDQHILVAAIAEVLPCRIVGDPLQGIFGFGDNQIIDWARDVEGTFETVDGPDVPWRWRDANPELGEWLQHVRCRLERNEEIDLRDTPATYVDGEGHGYGKALGVCMARADTERDSVIVIPSASWRCHYLASRLRGRFSCVEPIETQELYDAARAVDQSDGYGCALAVLDFARICMTRIGSRMSTIRNALAEGRIPKIRKNRDQLGALLKVAEEGIGAINGALEALEGIPGSIVYRRELLREMKRAVRAFLDGKTDSLEEAAWVVRNRTRRRGRILPQRAVGPTLLVKGLEFDHAIVLDAEDYDARNLYVAMTRGAKSLTIVSRGPVLRLPRPRDLATQ